MKHVFSKLMVAALLVSVAPNVSFASANGNAAKVYAPNTKGFDPMLAAFSTAGTLLALHFAKQAINRGKKQLDFTNSKDQLASAITLRELVSADETTIASLIEEINNSDLQGKNRRELKSLVTQLQQNQPIAAPAETEEVTGNVSEEEDDAELTHLQKRARSRAGNRPSSAFRSIVTGPLATAAAGAAAAQTGRRTPAVNVDTQIKGLPGYATFKIAFEAICNKIITKNKPGRFYSVATYALAGIGGMFGMWMMSKAKSN